MCRLWVRKSNKSVNKQWVIVCEECEETIKDIFKSVGGEENGAGIKSIFAVLKGKKPTRCFGRIRQFYFFYKKHKWWFLRIPYKFYSYG